MLSYAINGLNKTTTINIKLIDNLFTNKWKDYLVRTIKRVPNLTWSICKQPMFYYGKVNPINSTVHFHKLKESFEILQDHYGVNYTYEINDLLQLINHSEILKQSHLNRWHRHFTTNAVKFVANQTTHHLIPNTDTPDDVIFAAIHALNQHVHKLEILTSHDIKRREWLENKSYYGIHSADSFNLSDNASLWGNGMSEGLGEDFSLDDDYHHTVWMADDIQGKDHFKCWYDEDDASNDDIWGNTFMTPNISLDPDMIYGTTMNNPEFKQFVIDSKKPINRYPIGDILDMENIDWTIFKTGKLISIVLDGVKITPSFTNV